MNSADNSNSAAAFAERAWRLHADMVGEHYAHSEVSPEALLAHAAWLLGREAWAERVHAIMGALGYSVGPYVERYGEKMERGAYALHKGSRDSVPGLTGTICERLNLTIQAREGDRARVVHRLIDAGVIEGWDGSETDFEEAHSGYGWISVRA